MLGTSHDDSDRPIACKVLQVDGCRHFPFSCSRQLRDSVVEATAKAPESTFRRGMEHVIGTLVQDVARDMVSVRLHSV